MKDVFAVVTRQIISLLEQGIVPWRRPWDACWPTSYQTNKEYQGINVLLLQSGYSSPYWLTFRQAQKLGGSIRAGERGRPIVFVDNFIKENIDREGHKEIRVVKFLKYYTVFNLEQTKGIPEKEAVERDNQQITSAEELLKLRNPAIVPDAHSCYYLREDDALHLPPLERFHSSEDYYAAAFHELTHWTGGAARINRPGIRHYFDGDSTKSLEELTAEMGAAFLCQIAQLDTSDTIQNSAAYIASWLKHLQENPKWVLQASKLAREAVEYILNGQLPRVEVNSAATAAEVA
jgi:antirestriction protein ArdC